MVGGENSVGVVKNFGLFVLCCVGICVYVGVVINHGYMW